MLTQYTDLTYQQHINMFADQEICEHKYIKYPAMQTFLSDGRFCIAKLCEYCGKIEPDEEG
ncbi:hypothetical protein FY048_00175 [Acinetobacter sp. 1124_18A]|uniref:hypothetical protein n=1 Tax=Acinetobacter sp. 1124_18A TaxID=2605958 RepID=UPI004057EFD6